MPEMPNTIGQEVADLLEKRGISDPDQQIRLMDAIEAILVASLMSGIKDKDAPAVFGVILEMFNNEVRAQAAHVH